MGKTAASLPRRTLLRVGATAAAACAAAGCARLRLAPASASARDTARTLPPLPITLAAGDGATDAQAFAAFDHAVLPVALGTPWADQLESLHRMPQWRIAPSTVGLPPGRGFPSLDGALRLVNFDGSAVLAEALDAFAYRGLQYGMPVSAAPYGLLYQPHAFAAAGVRAPRPGWTLDEFVQACGAIQAVAATPALAGLYGPLPPLLGTSTFPSVVIDGADAYDTRVDGALADGVLISAFVAGYGGWLAQAGAYDFTNAGALAGLTRLVEVAVRCGAPRGFLPHSPAEQRTYLDGAAMRVAGSTDFLPSSTAAQWRWAPLPVWPVRAAVPVRLAGVQLAGESTAGRVSTWSGRARVEDACNAVVSYALWQYARVRDTPGADLPPPVAADAGVQARYWAAAARGGQGTLGNWRDYFALHGGWPPTVAVDVDAALFQAVSVAATGGQDLPSVLAAAEARCNQAAAAFAQKQGFG